MDGNFRRFTIFPIAINIIFLQFYLIPSVKFYSRTLKISDYLRSTIIPLTVVKELNLAGDIFLTTINDNVYRIPFVKPCTKKCKHLMKYSFMDVIHFDKVNKESKYLKNKNIFKRGANSYSCYNLQLVNLLCVKKKNLLIELKNGIDENTANLLILERTKFNINKIVLSVFLLTFAATFAIFL
jgi:hypothetical protein